ncbi:MAG: hypothetical protein ACI9A7_001092 [Cyclobacteriaceae bacterium]|jgi:hypothetical protein
MNPVMAMSIPFKFFFLFEIQGANKFEVLFCSFLDYSIDDSQIAQYFPFFLQILNFIL